jgi:hypothetical protein
MSKENQKTSDNFTTMGFVIFGMLSICGLFLVLSSLPDIGNSSVLENYNGIDHYHNGNVAFMVSLGILLVAGLLFWFFTRKMIRN